MAESRILKLSKGVNISFDAFWRISKGSRRESFYILPCLRIHKLDYEVNNIPRYVIQFNWLYLLSDINIFKMDYEREVSGSGT